MLTQCHRVSVWSYCRHQGFVGRLVGDKRQHRLNFGVHREILRVVENDGAAVLIDLVCALLGGRELLDDTECVCEEEVGGVD